MLQIALLNKIFKSSQPPFYSPPSKGGHRGVKGKLGGIRGFSLIEVMIALVVLLLVSLALMQTALVSIDANMTNILRDEAVSIAEESMNEARNIPFDTLSAGASTETVNRSFRRTNVPFTVTRTVTNLPPTDPNPDNKQINITVTWEWKEKTVANGNPYTHSITTIVRRP